MKERIIQMNRKQLQMYYLNFEISARTALSIFPDPDDFLNIHFLNYIFNYGKYHNVHK